MDASLHRYDITGMTSEQFQADVSFREAVEMLRKGEPIIFPTDTVYGIGVAVKYASSPRILYDLKERSSAKPIPLLLGKTDDLFHYGSIDSSRVKEIVASLWPGALTLIVDASNEIPSAFLSEDRTIGVRVPDAPCVRALINEVGPLATTSANLSGDEATSTLADITGGLVDKVSLVLKDDQIGSNISSRVIVCIDDEIRVLR